MPNAIRLAKLRPYSAMRRQNTFVLPVILLAAATLATGGIVCALLWKEAGRIRETSLAAAQEQARAVADNVALTVAEAKAGVQQALLSFQGPDLHRQLDAWRQAEPLAAFAFLWSAANPRQPQIFADARAATERAAILRSPAGSWIWQAESKREADPALSDADSSPASNYADNTRQRSELRRQSLLSSQSAKAQVAEEIVRSAESTDWIQLRADSEYLLVACARWSGGSLVTGVAVSMNALRAIAASSFPASSSSIISDFRILDERGETFAASQSKTAPRAGEEILAAISLAPELPGWSLQVVGRPGGPGDALLSPGGIAAGLVLLTLLGTALWLAAQSRASQLAAARKVGFVANVSHELKTPLTTIRMFSELLRAGRVIDETKRVRYLETISGECRRLTRMVNNLLDFSQLERGKATLRPSLQPVVPLLDSFLEMRRDEIERAGFAIETDFRQAAGARAQLDSDALAQILGNLVDNALKYASSGKRLSLRAVARPETVEIELADAGPGLPRALRKGRFKPFERGDTSLTTEVAGFGLGLSIAQSLAEGMGARLEYRGNGDAAGACFALALRATEEPSR